MSGKFKTNYLVALSVKSIFLLVAAPSPYAAAPPC